MGTQQANPPQIGTCPSKGQAKDTRGSKTVTLRELEEFTRTEVKEFHFSHNSPMETVIWGMGLQMI